MTLKPIRHQNMTDAVYASLREAIFSREFAPGQRIDVDGLRQQLGVSRTPLKDALNRLAMEGLIRVLPRQGTFVTTLQPEEMADICDVRVVLEQYAVERGIARITPTHLEHLRAHVRGLRETLDANGHCCDHLGFVAHDHGFHRVIVAAAGSPRLEEVYEALNVHIQVARVYYMDADKRIDQVCTEHMAILRAYEARDVEAAKAAMSIHLATSKQAVLERLR